MQKQKEISFNNVAGLLRSDRDDYDDNKNDCLSVDDTAIYRFLVLSHSFILWPIIYI